MSPPSTTRHQLLLKITSSFCQSLTNPPSPADLITKFFTPTNPRITEHGPEWARSRLPFLAKTFSGQEECVEYFDLLSQTLKMDIREDSFPDPSSGGYVVDSNATAEDDSDGCGGGNGGRGMVSVVGKGTFASVETGKKWSEKFIYRFSGFDEEGRIGRWEIWADPLSAWIAAGGEEN